MDLLPSEEQLEIVGVVAGFLRTKFPTSVIRDRRHDVSIIDAAAWAECGQLGWFGLGLPERLGGVGYGMAEEALIFREIGRFVAPGPFLSTVLGARVAAFAGRSDVAAAIVGGDAPVAIAEPRTIDAIVGETLTGSFDLLDGPGARYVVVVTPELACLLDASQFADAEPVPCIDPAVRLSRVELTDAAVLAAVDRAADPVHLRGCLLVAATLTGIAEATRDMSSQYAKDRVQFGRPIGVNQAVKHACADMALRAEAATSQLLFAALSVDEGRADREFQVTSARIVATHAAIENASATVQVHGGMGYTFEHDSHLYVKRARVLDRMMGDVRTQQAALLGMAGAQ
jgi:alkylation response protein AidB-like acyl-CoA dehydrogenase